MVSEIEKMQSSLEVLEAKQKEKKQGEIDKKIQDLRDFDMKQQESLQKETNEKMKQVLEDIDVEIKKFAKENSYNIILDLRFLIYSEESMNITDKIIEILKNKK